MKIKQYLKLVGDFETTVFEGQDYTEVWSSAICEIGTENVIVHHSIDETFEYLKALKQNVIVYYHNLKFDGSFWLDYFMRKQDYKQALWGENEKNWKWKNDKDMSPGEFKYSVSAKGQWYSFIIRTPYAFIQFNDSLKLLPFSVDRIGKAFKTKHQKLEMEYKGFRYAGCEITDEEMAYIKNDVLVMSEAMNIMFNEGHDKLTIGSCCMTEYKQWVGKEFETLFPNLNEFYLDEDKYGYETADRYIRRSYRGAWCYVVPGKSKLVLGEGITADVNSLYSSIMHSSSGNKYPIGKPCFWKGDYIPEKAKENYYFVRIKTRFQLKEGYLPFIHIKGNRLYKGTECLTTSDIYDKESNSYFEYYTDESGITKESYVTLTLTCTDYELMKEHYHLINPEILDGCWFYSQAGLFDEYIDKYFEIKMNSKGAQREEAKLFLNNLYGKFATSDDSSFKVAIWKQDGNIGFVQVEENEKQVIYIPVGSAITSYSKNFTIRAAQKNYHGEDKPGFCYADTDSIHCDIPAEELVGINVHETALSCWKLESTWDKAYFTRQKTYIEHVVEENLESVTPYYNVKCAGLPKKCKDLFITSLEGTQKEYEEYEEAERSFLFYKDKTKKIRSMEDFNIGLTIPGKLRPVRIKGGVVLVDVPYQMR